MIIGRSFAWGHLGKTAGHTTWELFHLFPETIEYADRLGTNAQHTPFVARLPQIEHKALVLNIRRLPAWMLSHYAHVARWGAFPDYEPLPMASPYEMALSDAADKRIEEFTGNGRLEIAHWLRVEHLSEDFLAFISEHVDVPSEKRAQIEAFGTRNVGTYDRRVNHWFSPAHIALMYASNPRWAAVETAVYGDTLAEPAQPPDAATALSSRRGRSAAASARPWRKRLAEKLRLAAR